ALCLPLVAVVLFSGVLAGSRGATNAVSAHSASSGHGGHAAAPQTTGTPQPSCNPTGTASMTISGGGRFNPTSLTINAGTRVTWTNTGNDRARVRDVSHVILDSGDIQPGQTYS